ncbi:hypothetical protein SESBI_45954 [Sesbania bispinosa]|nr:hypothetical protein SESBI_45954 [Sesbania bispinosa]
MSAMAMLSPKTMAVEVTGGAPCDGGDSDEACAFTEKDEDIAITEDSNVTVESAEGGGEGRVDAEGDECLGDLVSDEVGFSGDDGACDVEEGLGEG